jgi:hypothetical protein
MTFVQRAEIDEFVNDLRSGLTDYELMEKYGLSARGLRRAIEKLIDADIVKISEVYHRPVFYDDSFDSDSRRQYPRHYLALLLPICDAENPEAKGWLTDVTERGIGIMGIRASVGEKKAFVLQPGKFSEVDEIRFEAVCHWAEGDDPDASPVAGFEISRISDRDLKELKKFIRVISVSN